MSTSKYLCFTCVVRDDNVEPLDPPPNSNAGDRVYVDGYQHDIAGGMFTQYIIILCDMSHMTLSIMVTVYIV